MVSEKVHLLPGLPVEIGEWIVPLFFSYKYDYTLYQICQSPECSANVQWHLGDNV